MKDRRNDLVDIAKGIGILLVVFGHVFISGSMLPFRIFIYSFHMPLFFYIGGLLFNANESFYLFLVKKIKSLLLPYFVVSIISYGIYSFGYIFVVKWLGKYNIPHFEPGLLVPLQGILFSKMLNGYMNFNMPLWFLTSYFVSLLLYKIVTFFVKNKLVQTLIVLFLSFISYKLFSKDLFLPWSIDTSLVSLVFVHLGVLSKDIILNNRYNIISILSANKRFYFYIIFSLMISIVLFVSSNFNGLVVMGENLYGNYILFVINAFLGVIFVFLLASICHNKYLLFVGMVSFYILAIHNIIIYSLKAFLLVFFKYSMDFINSDIWIGITVLILTLIIMFPLIVLFQKIISLIRWGKLWSKS